MRGNATTNFCKTCKMEKAFRSDKFSERFGRVKVIEMFPKFSAMLSRKKDSNKADAILIANYHQNTHEK